MSKPTDNRIFDIEIADRELTISCPDDEMKYLDQSVAMVEKTIQQLQQRHPFASREHLALIAALNCAQRYNQLHSKQAALIGQLSPRISKTRRKVEKTLENQTELEV